MLKRAPSDGSFLVRKKSESEYAISFRYIFLVIATIFLSEGLDTCSISSILLRFLQRTFENNFKMDNTTFATESLVLLVCMILVSSL